MPLGTLDRQPPPFFRQGPSAQSKLAVYSALAIFLMVADARFGVMQPLRTALATALYPVQWVAMLPARGASVATAYMESLTAAQEKEAQAHFKLASMSARANQVEQLTLENERLRKLLDLRGRTHAQSLAAQVLYDAADPFTRKVIIDKGMTQGIALGSPVLDESGVVGQVTRIYPLVSEVTLVIDRDHSIPVLNVRTGARGVAFGDMSSTTHGMELRYMAANADVSEGDILNTSGVDGIYPPGLPVARVSKVERRVDTVFARIYLTPIGRVSGTNHVLVLEPVSAQIPPRPEPDPTPVKKGGGK
ncbi:rod shape-determining protein MreC [Curvibacter sp. APW13]|uniref:rod shape-determining protein MreC n=1 Tax=Curvibacter sp. APW13 TaxID=3077236 RepID=UPI0028E05159|nr:rod shape-determining protein MreC [Curvibacter sp. APW13]MDT8990205.1 rod shape-determining protein MreC [Curvibacter sp. APW13]